ncbi:hypothetical protein L6452_40707 [Arctium lappa]|uniref:Uncharacterized protein n=1 Tax=Arctium lappa TaxID=4217 RepID=A0ACB8XNI4_ARCLA|nr:hypothetical protein L6452_40707 [Arctium lappa]
MKIFLFVVDFYNMVQKGIFVARQKHAFPILPSLQIQPTAMHSQKPLSIRHRSESGTTIKIVILEPLLEGNRRCQLSTPLHSVPLEMGPKRRGKLGLSQYPKIDWGW